METDVLIIGAGAAGLTAALSAHEAGAKVVILEKGERLGGSAAISGGIVWVPNNPQMQAAGIADSHEDAMAYFQSLDHGEMDEEVLGAFVKEGQHALKFLDDVGATKLSMLEGYPDYYLDRPGAKPGGGRGLDNDLFDFNELGDWKDKVFDGGDFPRLMLRETPLGGGSGMIEPEELERRVAGDLRGWGQALVGRLLKQCLSRGIKPILGAIGVQLVVEGERVVGARFGDHGVRDTINASQGVVLATGGFEWNEELKTTFLRGPLTAPASPPTNKGDGLKMAMGAGASLGNMTSAWWVPTISVPGAQWKGGGQRSLPVLIERTLPHTVMVNTAGKRFCNEANNYASLAGAFHSFDPATYDYPNLPAYLIFDHQYLSRYPLASVMPGQDIPDWIVQAESLEALAGKLEIDAAQLNQTIERFNTNAKDAMDPDFGRGESEYDRFYGDRSRAGAAATLGPIEQAPYYAVEIKSGALGTNGGAKTDASGRIIGHDGRPIAGLYGAGNVISCPTGSVYAGAGGTLGPALTFGYIAGRAAARRENI
ncbi:FAD-dependent oxidoreductase [Parasphingorhabdus halotolerans]|uniref:FAD-dependent oxidoreductase n=1 Tax=Parasphingorhabdus halotolerans TaxID=2725558 RepID=A0A6H2DSP1_9SPHN|nr:FAD-dependent oxidoreductase [Parasphingorhabdus halotolerans]